MLAFTEELRGRWAGLRVLNLGGGDVDTATSMGSMRFTILAALGQMKHGDAGTASSLPKNLLLAADVARARILKPVQRWPAPGSRAG